MEECARGMGRRERSNDAATKDVQIKLIEEECALDTGQSATNAAVMDVQMVLSKEECAGGMGHITTQMMVLLHLDQNSSRRLQLNPSPMSMFLKLPSRDELNKAFPDRCPYSVKKYTRFKTCSKVLPYSFWIRIRKGYCY